MEHFYSSQFDFDRREFLPIVIPADSCSAGPSSDAGLLRNTGVGLLW
jgi:hypothetical protein